MNVKREKEEFAFEKEEPRGKGWQNDD